ncbi:MAG: hypothetical protein GEV28_27960 [Actinophytocola sp.]|uniref:hypothetical protein n=1 Tax=Actinophytocola sp. TaxID=1872138 RepID=UPI001328E124|nr:hypothetical protein [Actinophytocola sp.]MPZ84022.1 hypothetical protein [Actinophytocola sp.]
MCGRCANRLAWRLHDIPDLFAMLDEFVVPGVVGAAGGRRAPGFSSRSPARDDVIALRDRRTTVDEEGDPHSALELLAAWADNVRDDLALDMPAGARSVVGEARLLSAHLGHIAAAGWVTAFAEEISELHQALRRVTGTAARIVDLGPCPADTADTETGDLSTCGAALRAELDAEACQCRRCGASWPRQTWLHLADRFADRLDTEAGERFGRFDHRKAGE